MDVDRLEESMKKLSEKIDEFSGNEEAVMPKKLSMIVDASCLAAGIGVSAAASKVLEGVIYSALPPATRMTVRIANRIGILAITGCVDGAIIFSSLQASKIVKGVIVTGKLVRMIMKENKENGPESTPVEFEDQAE